LSPTKLVCLVPISTATLSRRPNWDLDRVEIDLSDTRELKKLTCAEVLKLKSGDYPYFFLTQANANIFSYRQIKIDKLDINHFANVNSTAEIAANSPRYRRRSSTFIDGVHDLPDDRASPMAPAQLYSTMSGRLFHSGRIAIVLVGPPARGKT